MKKITIGEVEAMLIKSSVNQACDNYYRKLELLIKEHNDYKRQGNDDAVSGYRAAIDTLVDFANRSGKNLSYTVDAEGYLICVNAFYLAYLTEYRTTEPQFKVAIKEADIETLKAARRHWRCSQASAKRIDAELRRREKSNPEG